jgi:Uma2 family endonuclease
VLNPAPEICVEVLSPSNRAEDIELKKRLYFEETAEKVWVCGLEGQMKFFSSAAELEASKLCPRFPKRILTSHERVDLEQQKEVSRKANRTSQVPKREPGREPPGLER